MLAVSPDGQQATALAGSVRRECFTQIPGTLSEEETKARLRGQMDGARPAPVPVNDAKAALAEAERLFAADFKTEEAITNLEALIRRLDGDVELTPEKVQILLRARAQAALVYISKGGSKETGRGETADGRRARDHLVRALLMAPIHQLDPGEYPPRVRLALDFARRDVAALGSGFLSVNSASGAPVVFVDGRAVGEAPVRVSLPRGTHRIWLEKDGRRSMQRAMELASTDVAVEIDFAFESALSHAEAALTTTEAALTDVFLRRVSAQLGGVSLVLVHEFWRDGHKWAGMTIFDAEKKAIIRTGSLSMAHTHLARALAQFASLGEGALQVRTQLPLARVWLNDILVGETPMSGPVNGLAPGHHVLRVKHAASEVELVVDVQSGQTTAVNARKDGAQVVLEVVGGPASPSVPLSSVSAAAPTPSESAAPGPSSSSALWLALAGPGAAGILLGTVAGLGGVAAALVTGIALALAPRTRGGQFAAVDSEDADQAQMRIGLLLGGFGGGLAVLAVSALVAAISVGLIGAGIALR